MPVNEKLKGKKRKYRVDKVAPSKVDFFTNSKDFECYLLASAGFTTQAISERTGLTYSQVNYRIYKVEKNRKFNELTARAKYRHGQSDVANFIAASISSSKSVVKKQVQRSLESRDLWQPRINGVLREDKSLPKVKSN